MSVEHGLGLRESGFDGDRLPIATARDHLIATLAAISTAEQARAVVDALDVYLEEPAADRTVLTWENLTPNYRSELEKVRAERDAALDCAEQALKTMQTTIDALRAKPAPSSQSPAGTP